MDEKTIAIRNGYTIMITETNSPKIIFFNKDNKVVFELNVFIEDFTQGKDIIPIKIHKDFNHVEIHPILSSDQEDLSDWMKKR